MATEKEILNANLNSYINAANAGFGQAFKEQLSKGGRSLDEIAKGGIGGVNNRDERGPLRSFADAVRATGVSDVTLRRYAKRKLIRTVSIGRRVLIPQSEIDRICREGIRKNG